MTTTAHAIATAHTHVRNTLRRVSAAIAALQARGTAVPGDATRTAEELDQAEAMLAIAALQLEQAPPAAALQIHISAIASPPGKLAEAELHFLAGPLAGLKLIGFTVWERRSGTGKNVTFPARSYAVNGERRSFALLRPSDTLGSTSDHQARIRDLILDAYDRHTSGPFAALQDQPSSWRYDQDGRALDTPAPELEPETAPAPSPADQDATPLPHMADHSFTRESPICPVCNNRKDRGLLLCWTCYNATDARNGLNPSIAQIITNAEEAAHEQDRDGRTPTATAPTPAESDAIAADTTLQAFTQARTAGFTSPGAQLAGAIVQAVTGGPGPMPPRPRRF